MQALQVEELGSSENLVNFDGFGLDSLPGNISMLPPGGFPGKLFFFKGEDCQSLKLSTSTISCQLLG